MLETDMTDESSGHDWPRSAERTFARRMKRERLRRGWRQEDLAAALADTGLELHPSAIAKVEREPDPAKGIEPRMIRLNEATVIAEALGLTIDRMLSDDDIKEPEHELEELREHLARALAQVEAATYRAGEIRKKLSAAERRTKRQNVTPHTLIARIPDETRETAEAFLASLFRRTHADLVENGWGGTTPEDLIGQVEVIGQRWPDLAEVCADLAEKIEALANWWQFEGGAAQHDAFMNESINSLRRRRAVSNVLSDIGKQVMEVAGDAGDDFLASMEITNSQEAKDFLEGVASLSSNEAIWRNKKHTFALLGAVVGIQQRWPELSNLCQDVISTIESPPPSLLPDKDDYPLAVKLTLEPGDEIEHNRFGHGKVISTEGEGDRTTATIQFKNDVVNLRLKHARILRISKKAQSGKPKESRSEGR